MELSETVVSIKRCDCCVHQEVRLECPSSVRLLCPLRGETVVSTKRCDCCAHRKMSSLCPPSDKIVMFAER